MPMSRLLLLAGAAASLALACRAQEPSPKEAVPQLSPPQAEVPPPAAAACPAGGCCEAPHRLDYRVIWRPEVCAVQSIRGADIPVLVHVKSLRVVTKPERRLVTVYVIEKKEVERSVPVTRMVDCVVKDPSTGECHTECQPVTEMKVIKDTEFYTTPKEQEIFVPVSKVEEFDDVIPRKATVLSWGVDLVKHEVPIVLPPQEVPPNQVFLLPQPPCVEPYPPPTVKQGKVEKLPPPLEKPGKLPIP